MEEAMMAFACWVATICFIMSWMETRRSFISWSEIFPLFYGLGVKNDLRKIHYLVKPGMTGKMMPKMPQLLNVLVTAS